MTSILLKGIIRNGRVEVEEPINLPDGTEVSLAIAQPLETDANSDEHWDNTPEGIADWLKWYDALEPLILTASEEADVDAWMRELNAYGRAKMDKRTQDLFP
jgi:hypothetical protein